MRELGLGEQKGEGIHSRDASGGKGKGELCVLSPPPTTYASFQELQKQYAELWGSNSVMLLCNNITQTCLLYLAKPSVTPHLSVGQCVMLPSSMAAAPGTRVLLHSRSWKLPIRSCRTFHRHLSSSATEIKAA